MKIVNVLVFFMLACFLLSSCQKELNFDVVSGNSVGGLKSDTSHDCFPFTLDGDYLVDTVLNTSNFMDIQVNISVTGAYTIQSDTTNGYSFKGTGTVGTVGMNTVRLYGSGKPLVAETDQFIISYDTSVCIVDVDVHNTVIDATYTFDGAGGTCTGAVVSGTYMQGTPTSANNTAVISVNVTSLGNYNISTTTLNGITFSNSGAFTALGAQTVTLTATGTPAASGTFNFPISSSSGSCAFSVTFN